MLGYNPGVRLVFLWLLAASAAANALQSQAPDGRDEAIHRALNFLYKTAENEGSFERYGSDLLWCFYSIAHTPSDLKLRAVGDADDLYTEYHSAWTGIDGLRDYHFHGQVKKMPVRLGHGH